MHSTLTSFLFNPDQFGYPVLHPIYRLPDHHLRDGLELPIDGVLELLNIDRHWLEQNILHVAPDEVVLGFMSGEEGAKLSPLMTFMNSILSSKTQ
jgi:hypothetical protein